MNMGTAMHRCPICNSPTRQVLPQRGDLDAVVRCMSCSVLVLLDSHPSAPEGFPADRVQYNRAEPESLSDQIQLSPAYMRWRQRETQALPN